MTEEAASTQKAVTSMKEVQDTLSRISSHKGVQSVMILNQQGSILQSTWSEQDRLQHASLLLKLVQTASTLISTLNIDSDNESADKDNADEVSFVTIRSKKQYEIMIAPDKEYLLVVLQKNAPATAGA